MVTDSQEFSVVEGWEQLPEDWTHLDVADVAVDAQDRVFVFGRRQNRVIIYAPDGSFIGSWESEHFTNPHALTIGPDGNVYTVDDGEHTLRKWTPEGELLMTLGTPGQPSDTGSEKSADTITHVGPPFNRPTKAWVFRDGRIYVTDGYGNARVHRFSADGELELSWGAPGEGPGEFVIPHSIAASPDETRIYVADRENNRIQVFDPNGGYIEEFAGLTRPCGLTVGPDGNLYVGELGERSGRTTWLRAQTPESPFSRCSILSPEGEVLARWGTPDSCAPGSFYATHALALDSKGDLYVGEVTYSAGGKRGEVPEDCHTLQKFERVSR